ncbi:MAG: S8 family serine peptidase [Burkholderiales bacterium]|nr:S8 family serine peptidase [Burkholderiales bacterium]
MRPLRIGIVDTGVNAWHSHVRGTVDGCRIYATADGVVHEDDDFRDVIGHGTAVAGVIRSAFPDAAIYAVRVFGDEGTTWPSLVARGILRAAGADCDFVNLSLAVPPGPGAQAVAAACSAALDAGCVIVASAHPDRPGWLPASLPGVHAVTADVSLAAEDVRECDDLHLKACGAPRDLGSWPGASNLNGHSFACARALVHLARRRLETLSPSA